MLDVVKSYYTEQLKTSEMKTIAKLGIVLALTGSLFASCSSQAYVTERPVEPVYVRPVAP